MRACPARIRSCVAQTARHHCSSLSAPASTAVVPPESPESLSVPACSRSTAARASATSAVRSEPGSGCSGSVPSSVPDTAVVSQAPESSSPTRTSGTTRTEDCSELGEKVIAPSATGPVPGRTSASRHQAAPTTARHAARSVSMRSAPWASITRARPRPMSPRPSCTQELTSSRPASRSMRASPSSASSGSSRVRKDSRGGAARQCSALTTLPSRRRPRGAAQVGSHCSPWAGTGRVAR